MTRTFGSRRVSAIATASAAALVLSGSVVFAQTSVTLVTTASPSTAQPGVNVVTVTGSAFPTGTIAPTAVTVTLAPAIAGAAPTATVASSAVVLVKGTSRRVSFIIPPELTLTKPAKYTIHIAGATTTGVSFQSSNAAKITINPPARIVSIVPNSIAAGATASVTIKTQYTKFLQGVTTASFGPGISVGGAADGAFGPVTVTTATTAVAQITATATATGGVRVVTIKTGAQQASSSSSFTVSGPATTLPTITASVTPTANANGWHNTAVTVSFTCSPSGASIVSCSPPVTVSNNGAKQVVTGTVRDQAGHEASTSVTLNIDRTPPTITLTSPVDGAVLNASPAQVSGNVSDALSGVASASCNGGAAAVANGALSCQVPLQNGSQQIAAVVVDAAGNQATRNLTVTYTTTGNRTPIAVAGGPYTADAGAPVSFNGSQSADPDGDVLTYSWSFGDGGNGAGERPRRTYLTPGTFTATLTVNDGHGGTHSASAQVTIRQPNRTPIADVGGPYAGVTAQAISFSAAASTDPDNDPLTYSWTFGDGSGGTGRDLTHAFTTAGSFSVSVTVSDNRGGSHTASAQVDVSTANRAPTAHAGGPYSGRVGLPINFNGTQSSDPDGDPLTFAWSFGDGGSRTGAQPQYTFDAAGKFTVSLTVADSEGGSHTAAVNVVITAADPTDNRPPIARAGGPYAGEVGIPLSFNGSTSSDPDGDALQYSWSFGDGATANGPRPAHTFSQAKSFDVQLTVSDGRGGSHTSAVNAVIAAPIDRIAPVVSLTGPTRVLPGTDVVVTATAIDNVSVTSVAFAVDGSQPSTSTTAPYQRTVAIPNVASPGTTMEVTAVATDPAGNTGNAALSLTIDAQPDTVAPTVTLAAPAQTGAGASLRVGATAQDASGIASITFRINGVAMPGGAAPYSATYQVPANVTPGTVLPVVVEAFDFAGNRGAAEGSVTVVAARDVTPPTVTLTTPTTSRPGVQVALLADAADQGGIASVTFIVNDVAIASIAGAPFQTTFRIPENAVAGMRFNIVARAIDFAGLESTDTDQIEVLDAAAGDALLTGEVYDDSTGLPLAGASVSVAANGAATTTTDARGRYALRTIAGEVTLRIARAGWTTVERLVSAGIGEAREVFDARLTPVGGQPQSVAGLEATLQHNGVAVAIPAGAVTAPVSLTLTRISGQGLRGLLPRGWTPVAAFDLAPVNVAFVSPVVVRAPRNGLAANTPLVFAKWDVQQRVWRAIATLIAGSPSELLQSTIDGSGHYAWLKADVLPASPPSPALGAVIAGVAASELPDSVQTVVNPQPKVTVYQAGVRSDVAGTITSTGPLSSGTQLWSHIVESYLFLLGSELHPEPFVQDLVFYQKTDDDKVLIATYVVTPSVDFEAATLKKGTIGVELFVPLAATVDVVAIGAAGGHIALPSGERLDIGAGLTDHTVAVRLAKVAADQTGVVVPAGFAFVDALLVELTGGTLAESAVLSIPKPGGIADTAQLLLARVDTIQGQTKLVLVGLAGVSGNRIVSSALLPRNKVPLEGIRRDGRYVFLRALTPVGFVAGQVIAPSGSPFTGAQISADTVSIVALSRTPGVYVAVATVGTARLTALDLLKSDTGSGQVGIPAAAAEAALDLRLIPQPPRVVSVSPGNGSRNIALSDPLTIVFSESVEPSSIAGNVRVVGPGGQFDHLTSALSANNTTLTLRPTQALDPDATYTLTIEKIKDRAGYEMPGAVVVQFATLDTTAPAPPAAGSLSATIPVGGTTTVRASQGTAGAHDSVVVENRTRGTITPVLLDPNGGFVVIVQASATDLLKVKVTDQAGNEAILDVPAFTRSNDDGSVSAVIGAEGGRVLGPDGIAADIQPDTLPPGTIVTLQSVSEANFPVQLAGEAATVFPYAGGIKIDFGGVEPQKYVNLSIPATANDTVRDQWIVGQAIEVAGEPTLNMVDTARLIEQRIGTSSPPCPGVIGAGIYGIYRSTRQVGIGAGSLYSFSFGGLHTQPVSTQLAAFFAMPFVFAYGGFPMERTLCLPVLTGNVTVVPNTITLRIEAANVTPADREFVVKNASNNTEAHIARDVLEYRFDVPGSTHNSFQVVAQTPEGTRVLTGVSVRAGATGRVIIVVELDTVNVAVNAIVVRNLSVTPIAEHVFPQQKNSVDLKVAGGFNDNYEVKAISASGLPRTVPFVRVQIIDNLVGTGNLLARAAVGAIDPTPSQIAEYNAKPVCGQLDQPPACRTTNVFPADKGVTDVYLADRDAGESAGNRCRFVKCWTIPLASIVNGGFAFAFNGDISHRYVVIVYRENGEFEETDISIFRITVRNPQTGRVIRTITGQSPPRNEPIDLGFITDDTTAPKLTKTPQTLNRFDPSSPLSFTFSEGIDYDSLQDGAYVERVINGNRTRVNGEWIVSDQNRVATFIPDAPLQIAAEYRVTFGGADSSAAIIDRGRNELAQTVEFTVKTFKPRAIAQLDYREGEPPFEAVKDVAVIRDRDANNALRTRLVAVTDTDAGYKLLTIDASDPRAPVETGHGSGGRRQKRVTAIADVENLNVATQAGNPYHFPAPCVSADRKFNGDLAVSVTTNVTQTSVQFFDVTNPAAPCQLGGKPIAVNPEQQSDFNKRGTFLVAGTALGVSTIKHSTGYAAYVAIAGVGLAAVDIGRNIPEVLPDARQTEGILPGDFVDVITVEDRLIALNKSERRLQVVDANLSPIAAIDLPEPPRVVAYADAFLYDVNGDGQIEPSEQRDLAFVGAGGCGPEVDLPYGQCLRSIHIVDLTTLNAPAVIGRVPMPGIVHSIQIDRDRRRVIAGGTRPPIGVPTGTAGDAIYMVDVSKPDQIGLIDRDNDADHWDDRIVWHADYVPELNHVKLDVERGLLYAGYGTVVSQLRGLDIWALYDNCCDLAIEMTAVSRPKAFGDRNELLDLERQALQQGIATGLNAAAAACGAAAIAEVKMLEQGSGACLWNDDPGHSCGDNYQPGLSDHDYEVLFPAAVPLASQSCVVGKLATVFTDPATEDANPITLPDGRQMYFDDITFFPFSRDEFYAASLNIEPPRSEQGDTTGDLGLGRQQLLAKWVLEGRYVIDVPGFNLEGRPLKDILEDLREHTKIPQVEGYEWSQLQRFNLAKSGAFVRIKGASDIDSTFHKLFIKQLHDAGKAAIRAALARMVADEQGRDRVLATAAQYEKTACLLIEPGQNDPGAWLERGCRSFEEFVASMAGWMLKRAPALPLFTVQQVHNIQRFYRVKADLERVPGDSEADEFIAAAANFVDAVATATKPIFDVLIPSDPRAQKRLTNIASAQTKAADALAKGKLTIAPFVANKGFINATQVKVTMYRNGNATPVKTVPVDLSGGERQRLDYVHTSTGSLVLDAQGKAEPVFRISPIDQNANFGVPMPVSFAIDLPEKKVKEGNRQNNHTGFHYYVLNRKAPAPPPMPAQPPLPIPDPGGQLLAPDAVCYEDLTPRFTQTFILSDGQETRGDLLIGMDETIRIRVEVFNTSGEPMVGAKACPGLIDGCVSVPTLAAGTGWVREFTYTAPKTPGTFPGTAQLTGLFGLVDSSEVEVAIACQSFDIVPIIDPEFAPGIRQRKVMIGGKALRYYRIVDKRTGRPKANAQVKLELSGSGIGSTSQVLTLSTNADGIVISPEALPTEPAIVLATTNYNAGSVVHAQIIEVDGVEVGCGNRAASFDLEITERTSSQTYQSGLAIEGSIGAVAGVEGTRSNGLELSRQVKSTRAGQFEPTALSLTRSKEKGVKASVEFNLIPEIEIGLLVGSANLSSTAGMSETERWSNSEKYTFTLDKNLPGGLNDAQKCAVAALTLDPIAAIDPLVSRLLLLFKKEPCALPSQFLTSTSDGHTRSSSDSLKIGLSAKPFWVKVNDWEKQVAISASAGGTELFSIATTLGQTFKSTATGPQRVSGNEDYTLQGGLNLAEGLKVTMQDQSNPTEQEKKELLDVGHFKKSVGLTGEASTVGTYSVSFIYPEPPPSSGPQLLAPPKASSISISYTGPKAFGWRVSELGGVPRNLTSPTPTGKISYTFSDPDAIDLLTDPTRGLANLATIQKTNTPGELGALELGFVPTILNTELSKFRTLKREMVTNFSVTNAFGSGYELPLTLKIKEAGIKFGGSVKVKSDTKVGYTTETGMNVRGQELTLERYEKDAFIPAADLGLGDLLALSWEAALSRYLSAFSDVVKRIGNTVDQIKSNFTATLTVNSAAEAEKFDLGLFSYPFERLSIAPREGRYVPSNNEGVATDPHYGIGGFHQFTPQDRMLASPATLVIDYKDDEIQGLDESSLAIYAWNGTSKDWDFVGGTRDPAANTVTTTINQLRLYTLAPAMPRGDVALAIISDTFIGDDANAKRRVRVASTSALTMNNGQPVANGTLFTVRTVVPSAGPIVPVGTILTPDADGTRDNVQVAVVNGRVEFEVEVPAPFRAVVPAQAVVYSTKGTAFGSMAVQQ